LDVKRHLARGMKKLEPFLLISERLELLFELILTARW
jgi:hypothetical protein